MADNSIGAQFPGGWNLIEDSVIIGESDNIGTSANETSLIHIKYYLLSLSFLGNPEILASTYSGRTRPSRWYPQNLILGYRHYDSGTTFLFRSNSFLLNYL